MEPDEMISVARMAGFHQLPDVRRLKAEESNCRMEIVRISDLHLSENDGGLAGNSGGQVGRKEFDQVRGFPVRSRIGSSKERFIAA